MQFWPFQGLFTAFEAVPEPRGEGPCLLMDTLTLSEWLLLYIGGKVSEIGF